MAELILESSDKSSNNTSDVSATPIIQPEIDQVEYDTWISLLKSKPISRLQVCFCCIIKKFVKFTFLGIDEDLILFSDYPYCHHVFSDDDIFHVFGLCWPSG